MAASLQQLVQACGRELGLLMACLVLAGCAGRRAPDAYLNFLIW